MKAWYFSNSDCKLRYGDNRPIVVGKMHTVSCKPILCEQGLHASVNVLDALRYAPGPYVWRVELSGGVIKGDDKIAGQRRKYLWGFDATDVLLEFARKQAMINIELIKPYTDKYDLIVEYLTTGREEIRDAARDAAMYAARAATYAAMAATYAAWAATYAAMAATYAAWAAKYAAMAAGDAARAAMYDARDADWAAANLMLTEMLEEVYNNG